MHSAKRNASRDSSFACYEMATAARTVSCRPTVAWQIGALSQAVQLSQSRVLPRSGEAVVPLLCQSIDLSCNAIQPTVKTVFEWCRTMNKDVVCL
jgi:hypothetical protein